MKRKGVEEARKEKKLHVGKEIVELGGNSEFSTAAFSKIQSEMSLEWDGKAPKGLVRWQTATFVKV